MVVLLAAAWVAQDPPPRYTAAMLTDASFDQRVRAEVRTQSGGAARTEQVGREGRMEVRIDASGGDLAFESWFDSLWVWREGPEGRITPDVDGLIGGRFRGVFSPTGRSVVTVRPFVPDELVEVTDLGGALDDFLPPLPGAALASGEIWQEGPLRVARRPDSTAGALRLQRYRWSRVSADTAQELAGDSLRYEVRSTLEEEGDLVWHAAMGPLVWHRRAIVTMEIPAEGSVRRTARSRMSEESWVWRRYVAR
jgi:hypothetical protein